MTTSQETQEAFSQLSACTTQLQKQLETVTTWSNQFQGWRNPVSALTCRETVAAIESFQQTLQGVATLFHECWQPFVAHNTSDVQEDVQVVNEKGDEACIFLMAYSAGCSLLTQASLRKRKATRKQVQQFINEAQQLIEKILPLVPGSTTVDEQIPLQLSAPLSKGGVDAMD